VICSLHYKLPHGQALSRVLLELILLHKNTTTPKPPLNSMTSGDHGRMNTANQLPAMLSHVISWLSIDEAVRSSILPKRWKPLWKHASCLDFDVSSVIKSLSQLENSSSRVVSFDEIKAI